MPTFLRRSVPTILVVGGLTAIAVELAGAAAAIAVAIVGGGAVSPAARPARDGPRLSHVPTQRSATPDS